MTTYISQAAYSRHRGVSSAMVSKYISKGQLKKSVKVFGKRNRVNIELADQELADNLDRIQNRTSRQPPAAKPTKAEIEAATWNANQPDLEHSFLESLRYLCKLAELNPKAVRVIQPGDGQEGIIIRYREVDEDNGAEVACPAILNICHIFENPADMKDWCRDYDTPKWYLGMDAEARERLR